MYAVTSLIRKILETFFPDALGRQIIKVFSEPIGLFMQSYFGSAVLFSPG
jgi:hypothetical protein